MVLCVQPAIAPETHEPSGMDMDVMERVGIGVEDTIYRPPDGAAPRGGEGRRRGMVFLVGAGPGDPELITLKGLRCLRAADVVVYDRLLSTALLDEARPTAVRIFAGKEPGCHTLPQERINALLIEHAVRGRVVVRLKGGDPFVFGRGGEEAAALADAGIPFEVVPGVTSAIAVPAYAGIPVTQRGHAPLLTVVTGHEDPARPSAVDWEALARLGGTLVVLMGVAALPRLTARLLEGGLSPDTPAAVIQEGTTPRQRTITGTLGDIAERAAAAGLSAPAITVIGAVAALRDTLAWYEQPSAFSRQLSAISYQWSTLAQLPTPTPHPAASPNSRELTADC